MFKPSMAIFFNSSPLTVSSSWARYGYLPNRTPGVLFAIGTLLRKERRLPDGGLNNTVLAPTRVAALPSAFGMTPAPHHDPRTEKVYE